MPQVFISYSREDLAFAKQLANDLRNAGLEVWHDISGIGGGTQWRVEIEKALRNSQFLIVILSPDSMASEWVEREFLYASRLNLTMIPLMYRPCEVSMSFINMKRIDVQGNNYAQNFAEILERLSVNLTGTSSLPKPSLHRNKTPYLFLVGGIAIIFIALLNLPAIKNDVSPTFSPTQFTTTAAKTQVPSEIVIVLSETPPPTVNVVSAWEQGKIAYVIRNSEKVYFLYTQDLSTGAQSQLLLSPENPSTSRYYAPWFAPNGQQLAYTDLYTGKVFIKDVIAKDDPRFVGNCYSPSFAPDGLRIICDANGTDYFRVYDVEKGNIVLTINHGKMGSVLPSWSPDGAEIAFSVIEENRTTTIWKVNIEDGVPVLLATGGTENYAPSWSPDGEWIAYQSTKNSDKSEVWIMRSNGSDKKQITFSGGWEIWSRGPCFSPDGKWLAFVSNQNETDGPDFGDVFVVSLETGEVHQITHTGGYVLDWRVTWAK